MRTFIYIPFLGGGRPAAVIAAPASYFSGWSGTGSDPGDGFTWPSALTKHGWWIMPSLPAGEYRFNWAPLGGIEFPTRFVVTKNGTIVYDSGLRGDAYWNTIAAAAGAGTVTNPEINTGESSMGSFLWEETLTAGDTIRIDAYQPLAGLAYDNVHYVGPAPLYLDKYAKVVGGLAYNLSTGAYVGTAAEIGGTVTSSGFLHTDDWAMNWFLRRTGSTPDVWREPSGLTT